MTCIVGISDKGKVYIGGDSAGVDGYNIDKRTDSKVFINKNMVIGFTTSFRMGQILRYSLTVPTHPKGMSTLEYMCTSFIDKVIETFKDKGWLGSDDIGHSEGGQFIVGYKGELFTISSDFQVACHEEPYMAVGCGGPYALGILSFLNTYYQDNISPEDKIGYALEAADKFSAGVCPPFTYSSL